MNRLLTIPAVMSLAACSLMPLAEEKPQEISSACEAAEFRQFDFWLGDWDVAQRDQPAHAENRISRRADGCALLEEYQTQGGYRGLSLNWYEPDQQAWFQLWRDNGGLVLRLRGGLDEQGAMILESRERSNAEGGPIWDRILWTAESENLVRQVWQVSEDAGQNWRIIFDGEYRRQSD